MSETKNDEYIEISITDILYKLWRNKIVFFVVFAVVLLMGAYFLVNKNYNQYSYKATIVFPVNSSGSNLLNVADATSVLNNKYNKKTLLTVNKNNTNSNFNLTYNSKQSFNVKKMDAVVNNYVATLNKSDLLDRATLNYKNSLNDSEKHISFLERKVKYLKTKPKSTVLELGLLMIEDNLIKYRSENTQAKLNLQNAKFSLIDKSVEHTLQSKKKYVFMMFILSLTLAFITVFVVDYLRERFSCNK